MWEYVSLLFPWVWKVECKVLRKSSMQKKGGRLALLDWIGPHMVPLSMLAGICFVCLCVLVMSLNKLNIFRVTYADDQFGSIGLKDPTMNVRTCFLEFEKLRAKSCESDLCKKRAVDWHRWIVNRDGDLLNFPGWMKHQWSNWIQLVPSPTAILIAMSENSQDWNTLLC